MITKKHLKIFLSFLSLVVLLLGSCKAGDKLGSVTQDSQNQVSQISDGENSGESVSNGLNTSLPIWNVKHSPIPEEYWGKYQYLGEGWYIRIATVTSKDITFSYKDDDGSFHVGEYFHVFDKNAKHWGDNNRSCWSWHPSYRGDNYINKYKNDFRISLAPDYIMEFERNEKGQRVLWYNESGSYVHEDDINK